MKIPVDGSNRLVYKLIGIKINHIHRFRADTLPKRFELRHGELVGINLQLDIFVAGVLRLHSAAVIDRIKNIDHRITAVRHFLRDLNCTICFIGIIFIGQYTLLVDIAVDNQIKINRLRRIAVHDLLVASGVHNDLALEQISGNSHRTSGNCIGKLSLQALCEAVIALTGDDGQNIDGLHIISKHVGVHALAVLIDAQAQATTDLLPLANLAAALFQCTNLEHIRVVPAFAQYTANTYDITWDMGNGESETTQQTYDKKLVLPTEPTRKNAEFLGWFTEATGGSEVTEDTIFKETSATTYYAHWEITEVFSVTVPVTLPLIVDENGKVYTGSAEIINGSTGAVVVSSVEIFAKNGWTLVPFTTDMAHEPVDSQQLGFKINNVQTTKENGFETFPLTQPWQIAENSSLPIDYDAVVSAVSQPVTEEDVLSVVFVLEWAEG